LNNQKANIYNQKTFRSLPKLPIITDSRRFYFWGGLVNHKIIVSTTLLGLFLAGCTADGPKESAGTFIGAATGALVGSQFGKGHGQLAGVAIGTLLGSQL
jgi:hypothetical protein